MFTRLKLIKIIEESVKEQFDFHRVQGDFEGLEEREDFMAVLDDTLFGIIDGCMPVYYSDMRELFFDHPGIVTGKQIAP